jgi:hypothetical protein
MKVKHYLPLLFFLLIVLHVSSQQPTRSEIERSGRYYYGTGIAGDENRARDEALQEISEMIAVTVESDFKLRATETDKQYTESATSVVKTYSTATLRNVRSLRKILSDGKIEIFSYITKETVQDIYNQRKELVHALYQEGNRSEMTGNLAFALKQWYFAIVLMNSVPEEHVVVDGINLTLELPGAINRVLSEIRFEVVADRQLSGRFREVDLRASFQGRPVSLLHYRFWDGRDNNGTGQVRDGLSTIRLAGASTTFDRIALYPQYEYYTARTESKIVEELWDLVIRPEFENEVVLSLKPSALPPVDPEITDIPVTALTLEYEGEIEVAEKIIKKARNFIRLINTGDYQAAGRYYGKDAFLAEKVSSYMEYNNPSITGDAQTAELNVTRTGFEARKIRAMHNFPSINRQSTEYLVLDFDQKGTLIDLNLCITDDLYEKFVAQADYGRDWDQRQEIIKFVEKYRTAFHTRDMSTIDKMFAEEALILIGRKIETRSVKKNEVVYDRLPGQPDFESIQLTKKEYLNRQKEIFDYQQDIFLDFSNFDIAAKSNATNVYGVQMRQHYSSTTYADEGYLFLLIDFHEKDPLIYIRAWQPNEWDSSTLVNAANFRVFK